MIFSSKLNKISSGKNISLYAIDQNNFDMYIFNKKFLKENLAPTHTKS